MGFIRDEVEAVMLKAGKEVVIAMPYGRRVNRAHCQAEIRPAETTIQKLRAVQQRLMLGWQSFLKPLQNAQSATYPRSQLPKD